MTWKKKMMNRNRLNWSTTGSTSDKYLYLSIMRDLKAYCKRGYCDVLVTLVMFSSLPKSLVMREYNSVSAVRKKDHIIIDWANAQSVKAAISYMISIIHEINHEHISQQALNEAFEEFTQYLTKNKV